MTKEEKQQLLVALCGYFPYGLMLQVTNNYAYHHPNVAKKGDITIDRLKNIDIEYKTVSIYHDSTKDYEWYCDDVELEDIKPYLRPMSSMTDEEQIVYRNLHHTEKWKHVNNVLEFDVVYSRDIPLYIDWLNAHHFDYRGLIEKGLATEAPKGMYN